MENLQEIVTEEDGRWEDEVWLAEQAAISAMEDAVNNGVLECHVQLIIGAQNE